MPTPFSSSRSSSGAFTDASSRLVSSRCPECGAPVDFRSVPNDHAQVKCSYCGTLIAIPGRTAARPENAVITTKQGTGCGPMGWGIVGWSVIILIVVVGVIGVWSTTMFSTAARVVNESVENGSSADLPGLQRRMLPAIELPLAPKPRLSSVPILLNGNENAAAQMVMAAYQDDGAVLVAFDPERRAEAWRSQLLSEAYYEMGVSADAERVYVADEATLMALDRTTGQTLWQTSLANNIQTGCIEGDPCLQQVGSQSIALARDGTLQGFAAATGAPLWSRRLNSQPRRFIANNDQVIVVDTDSANRASVLVLNAASGDVIYQFEPTCSFPNIDMRPHSSDQFLVTPDGSALIVVSSGTYACAWRYSLIDGTLTWNYVSPGTDSPLPFTWSMSSLAVADPIIYFVKDEDDEIVIYALDSQSQDATPQPFYRTQDVEVTVQYPVGDLLLVSANPDFAREEVELWAIDRATGERRWQRKLETTHTFDEWVTHPTDQGIFLAVCSWNNDECHFETLDLASGASKNQVREAAGTPFSGAAWRGNQGFLVIDGKLYAIDLRTAAIEYTWP